MKTAGTFFTYSIVFRLVISARLVGVPVVPFTATPGFYDLNKLAIIAVDSNYQNSVDSDGETIIPPTLAQFAQTFQGDFQKATGLEIPISYVSTQPANSIFLTIGTNDGFVDAAGAATGEAYSIDITSSGVTITGASSLGAWWGTRTVLQQAVLGSLQIPLGSGVDSPGWRNRGFMVCCTSYPVIWDYC